MFNAARLKARMAERKLSQSELARRVGVSQASIFRLVKGEAYGSKHLHRIARELGTTPAYLAGETDDPDLDAPPPPPPAPQVVMLGVLMPPTRALARMFEALLDGIDDQATTAERALLLAERLPIGLSQLRDLLPESANPVWSNPEREGAVEGRAMPDPEPIR
jgi:transcriptional regulator with XRE-family HTH domain